MDQPNSQPSVLVKKQENIQTLQRQKAIHYISLSATSNGITKQLDLPLLLQLKDVFSRQLPKMPKEYILKMVLDKHHECLAVVDANNRVIGGVCFREFTERRFAELVFLAVEISHQIKGFGTRLMNQFKNLMQKRKNQYIITFADNLALGYFKKQGFSTNFKAEADRWKGYIKNYEGGTIMEYAVHRDADYLNMPQFVGRLASFVRSQVKNKAIKQYKYSEELIPKDTYRHSANKDQSSRSQKRENDLNNNESPQNKLVEQKCHQFPFNPIALGQSVDWNFAKHQKFMAQPTITLINAFEQIINEMKSHPESWPFREPVPSYETEYYSYIQKPMDISKISQKLKQKKYLRQQEFVADVRLIFHNCKMFNSPETVFHIAASKLEQYISPKLTALQGMR